MSYILEALKKSERERELGHVPRLDTPQSISAETRRPRWQWGVLAVLLLNALLLSVVLLRPEPAPVHELIRLEPSDVPAPVVETIPAPVPAPVVAVAPQVSSPLPTTPAPAPTAPTPTAQALPPPETGMAARQQDVGSESKPAESAMPIYVPPSPALPVSVEAAESVPQAPAAVARDSAAQTQETDIPLWEEVPYNRRGGLTDLHLDVHVYDDKVARRFILVNLRKYREGDTLAEGPRVEAITPTGARMRYGELQFRLNRP